MKFKAQLQPLFAALPVLLAACGGGGGDASTPSTPPPVEPPVVTPPVTPPVTPTDPTPDPGDDRPDWLKLLGRCEHPRQGLQPNGLPYYDMQGTLTDELKWLRSFIDATYLWYQEVPSNLNMADYKTPIDYFAVLKTPALTPSGRLKDRYHFTYPSQVWEELSGSGVALGYGITWSRTASGVLPRVWVVSVVAPDSPAAAAGVRRGDVLQAVDAVDLQDSSVGGLATINAGLTPKTAGEKHSFLLRRDGVDAAVLLTSAKQAVPPVQNVKLLPTASGTVGYLQFDDHNGAAEPLLVDAFSRFRQAGVSDLVLDLRYNGGGYLRLASELAYMIAGPQATRGKVFEQLLYNDQHAKSEPQPFAATSFGYIPGKLAAGVALPSLNLKRVTVLTTPGTCSASESVINSLRGIDVEVNLIGGETCGKPYAFTPAANCGTTYFAIQSQGTNHKGFGDYADGFQPTCKVSDDLAHQMGDPAEGMLAAALSYRASGVCPATPQRNRSPSGGAVLQLERPALKEIGIRDR